MLFTNIKKKCSFVCSVLKLVVFLHDLESPRATRIMGESHSILSAEVQLVFKGHFITSEDKVPTDLRDEGLLLFFAPKFLLARLRYY